MNLVEVVCPLLERDWLDRGQVVGSTTLVVERHGTISLEVTHLEGAGSLVDWELLVVGSDSVSVSIGVGEQSRLEDGVVGWLDTGDHVRRVECNLLDLGKVVLLIRTGECGSVCKKIYLGVLVEGEFTDGSERVIAVRPDVSQVKDVDPLLLPSLLGLLLGHDLNLHRPRRVAADQHMLCSNK